mgnify:CR=1 FL=1
MGFSMSISEESLAEYTLRQMDFFSLIINIE